jgi:hypothetical protein
MMYAKEINGERRRVETTLKPALMAYLQLSLQGYI